MASKVFLRGDSDPLAMALPADKVLEAVEKGRLDGKAFIRLDTVPARRGEKSAPAYFDPQAVVAVMPMDQRYLDYLYDNPAEWLEA